MSEGWWDQFLLGQPVKPGEIEGDWAVQIVGGKVPPIPQKWTRHKKRFEKMPPSFDGCNLLFKKEKNLGFFKLNFGPSILYPQVDVLKINYSDPQNPRCVRPLCDEVVRLDDEALLGMATYKIFKRPFILCYFMLSRV